MGESLDQYRRRIDELDEQIVALLNQRTEAAAEIGRLKQRGDDAVYVPAREKAVFERVARLTQGPLTAANLRAIYREIMSASLSLETEMKVAFLGPDSTYTHQAARSRFGNSVEYIACQHLSEIFTSVQQGRTQYGVVPIENSIEGHVTACQDELGNTPLKICAEIYHSIDHCLLARFASNQIERIYSHPQALAQCRNWLRTHMPKAELVETPSTAAAAELAASEPNSAAIASAMAGEAHDLHPIGTGIQDVGMNVTRFLVVGKTYGQPTGDDKTSVHFAVKHEVGALVNALGVFEKHGLNLLSIESRPSRTKQWEYFFFVDFAGHTQDEAARATLEELTNHCMVMTVLGSYPKSPRVEGW